MWIDRETSLPRAVRTTMADGSRTSWVFSDMAVDVPLPDDTFDLAPPAGTRLEVGGKAKGSRITSYNVCYTKLLRPIQAG